MGVSALEGGMFLLWGSLTCRHSAGRSEAQELLLLCFLPCLTEQCLLPERELCRLGSVGGQSSPHAACQGQARDFGAALSPVLCALLGPARLQGAGLCVHGALMP